MNTPPTFKNIAEEYAHRIWSKRDLSAMHELLHPEIIVHSLFGDCQGIEQMKNVVEAWCYAFADLIVKNKAIVCEQDLVVIQWQAHGTHTGEFKGIKPAGKSVMYEGVTIYRIHDNKITEYWAYLDMLHLINQIR